MIIHKVPVSSRDFPTTSLATVYKTVKLLKEIGEVIELEFSQDSNRYDGNKPYPHPHVLCVECRRIVDPEPSGLGDLTTEVSRRTGFRILSHRLDFYGVCPDCQKPGEKGTGQPARRARPPVPGPEPGVSRSNPRLKGGRR